MINENELIMEIANWQESLIPHNDILDKHIYDTLEAVIETINKQPKIDSWIPCSEKLPKVKGLYTVIVSDYDGEHVRMYSFDPSDPKDIEFWSTGLDIKAWQLKPEPWKGAEE